MSHANADRKPKEMMKKIIATSLICDNFDNDIVSTLPNNENPADIAAVRTVRSNSQPVNPCYLSSIPLTIYGRISPSYR